MSSARWKEMIALERSALRAHLGVVLEFLSVDCVLDIGAFRGGYAHTLRSAGYTGWIVSFEPVSQAYARLDKASEQDEQWRTVNLALGSRDETKPINVAQQPVFSSFFGRNDYSALEFGMNTDTVATETVGVRSLDSILEECLDGIPSRRLFLKIDTQGWDLEVLRGAVHTLPRILGVQTEVSIKPIYEGTPACAETLAFLGDHGFELTGSFAVVRDRNLRVMELDCVMVRHEAVG